MNVDIQVGVAQTHRRAIAHALAEVVGIGFELSEIGFLRFAVFYADYEAWIV